MLTRFTVVVIGLGNLGKRHVEALLRSELDMDIHCVDIVNKSAEDFAESEWRGDKKLFFYTDYQSLPKNVDLAVIATVSSVRRKVFEQLVSQCMIKNIIFEKVLFTKIKDYEEVLEVLEKNSIKAWVNCGRRETEQYLGIKNLLLTEDIFEVHASGGRWGLFCNGIHLIDIIAYLTGNSNDLEISRVELWSEVFEGKRKGFFEAYGIVEGSVSRCKSFSISCFDSDMPLEVSIVSPNIRIIICEGERKVIVKPRENDWKEEIQDFIMPYVSTGMTAVDNRILLEGKSNLPAYKESALIHIRYLKCLEEYFGGLGIEPGFIPIT